MDGSSNTVVYTIPVGAYPTGIDLSLQTNKLYVANSADATILVVDRYTKTEVNAVMLPLEPPRAPSVSIPQPMRSTSQTVA